MLPVNPVHIYDRKICGSYFKIFQVEHEKVKIAQGLKVGHDLTNKPSECIQKYDFRCCSAISNMTTGVDLMPTSSP